MKKQKTSKLQIAIIAIMFAVGIAIISGVFYSTWEIATTRVSADIDCEINQIDYVPISNATEECAIPMIKGEKPMCALPRDIHCKGAIQNFPIIRGLMEAME